MKFSARAKSNAIKRQATSALQAIPCASCGTYLDVSKGEEKLWFAIERTPINIGGEGGDNCAIVCAKCRKELIQDGTKIIPEERLPFIEGNPKE